MNFTIDITADVKLIQKIVNSTLKGFIETGRYALSKRESYAQFGQPKIDLLIANGLLKDTSKSDYKAQYLLSDIITGIEMWENMKRKNQ